MSIAASGSASPVGVPATGAAAGDIAARIDRLPLRWLQYALAAVHVSERGRR